MDEQIRFYIPKSETIPTELRLYVNDVYVTYERTDFGFLFEVLLDDEEKALNIVKKNYSENRGRTRRTGTRHIVENRKFKCRSKSWTMASRDKNRVGIPGSRFLLKERE